MQNNAEFLKLMDLVEQVGNHDFDRSMMNFLDQMTILKYFSVFNIQSDRPQLLLSGAHAQNDHIAQICGEIYIDKFHGYDENCQYLIEKSDDQHQLNVSLLNATDIEYKPYRQEIYDQFQLNQRLRGVYFDEKNNPFLFNLYRNHELGFFSDQEIDQFTKILPMMAKLVQSHVLMKANHKRSDMSAQLIAKCASLTTQEVAVCERILKGMSYYGIAVELNLKESTIKTYRNRAFLKLNIHFKSQLFSMFMQ
ncbi:helix-turn-helix transcriptional regulator [Acinetobacter gerneri]|uniref:helix-turn-helix transcriptional regulator n=1 Tax=Acinetobacter gerneri TaxID=202952 RepID=UPI0028B235BB|nr:helix-turn-helix transcriptional regulator [Acinetobacter gerneri]